jgi:hypothetical protein
VTTTTKEKHVIIEIINWDKWNEKRKDVKSPSWLRLNNTLPTSQDLYGLTAEEKWVWVALLCVASQKQSAKFEIYIDWFSWYTSASKETILSCFTKLEGHTLQQHDMSETIATRTEAPKQSPPSESTSDGTLVFKAYSKAYESRYKVPPPRNAKVNSLCKQLVKRLGVGGAVEVAKFYLSSDDFLYAKGKHPLDLLLRDAEKVHTEWKTVIPLAPRKKLKHRLDGVTT